MLKGSSEVSSAQIPNPFKALWLSLLPVRMKKIQGGRVVTPLLIDLSDAQGQLNPKPVLESCRNSNLPKLLLLSLLPAKMKKIHPKYEGT